MGRGEALHVRRARGHAVSSRPALPFAAEGRPAPPLFPAPHHPRPGAPTCPPAGGLPLLLPAEPQPRRQGAGLPGHCPPGPPATRLVGQLGPKPSLCPGRQVFGVTGAKASPVSTPRPAGSGHEDGAGHAASPPGWGQGVAASSSSRCRACRGRSAGGGGARGGRAGGRASRWAPSPARPTWPGRSRRGEVPIQLTVRTEGGWSLFSEGKVSPPGGARGVSGAEPSWAQPFGVPGPSLRGPASVGLGGGCPPHPEGRLGRAP